MQKRKEMPGPAGVCNKTQRKPKTRSLKQQDNNTKGGYPRKFIREKGVKKLKEIAKSMKTPSHAVL
jgi:hypothetical protein